MFSRGASRDWATKGPLLLGVRAVLAVSFDPAHRANLVRTGILPVQIDRTTYEILSGREKLDIVLPEGLEDAAAAGRRPSDDRVTLGLGDGGFDLEADMRLDNSYEVELFAKGGVIKDLLRKSLGNQKSVKKAEETAEKTKVGAS